MSTFSSLFYRTLCKHYLSPLHISSSIHHCSKTASLSNAYFNLVSFYAFTSPYSSFSSSFSSSSSTTTTTTTSSSSSTELYVKHLGECNDIENRDQPSLPKNVRDQLRVLSKMKKMMTDVIRQRRQTGNDLIAKAVTATMCEEYSKLGITAKKQVLEMLAEDIGVDRIELQSFFQGIDATQFSSCVQLSHSTLGKLRRILLPLYMVLFQEVLSLSGGLIFLIRLRSDLLKCLKQGNSIPALRAMDHDLEDFLLNLLNAGLLQLKRLTWENSSAAVLEKVMLYEAVHPVESMPQLKPRLSHGRRVFAFFHPNIPEEPLVFVFVALLQRIPTSISEITSSNTTTLKPYVKEKNATTAIFYSITSPQAGLRRVDLGSALIKRVVHTLSTDLNLPKIQDYVTLSPIPGFRRWLQHKITIELGTEEVSHFLDKSGLLQHYEINVLFDSIRNKSKIDHQKEINQTKAVKLFNDLLNKQDWMKMRNHSQEKKKNNLPMGQEKKEELVLKSILMRLCARYLLQEKRRKRTLDPVANFHIRNGASVGQLNWLGDTSERGLINSWGIMVNYIYDEKHIEENNFNYITQAKITYSKDLKNILRGNARYI